MEWYEVLKQVRIERGLSLRQAAKKADLSDPYVSQLENGFVANPSFFKMLRLLSVYGLSVRDLGVADNKPFKSDGPEIVPVITTDFCERCNKLRILSVDERPTA